MSESDPEKQNSIVAEFTINNPRGLHSRPVAAFTKIIQEFPNTQISLECNGRQADGHSFLDVLALCASHKDQVTVKISDGDAEGLYHKLEAFFTEK